MDLHLREIFGDGEEDRRLQGRCDRLARVDVALQHDAVDRRNDARLDEIRLIELDIGFGNADIGLGTFDRRDGAIVGRLGRVEVLLRRNLLVASVFFRS